ncbi:hypothetical protein BGZ82_004193, partial [Podila clonocystis]
MDVDETTTPTPSTASTPAISGPPAPLQLRDDNPDLDDDAFLAETKFNIEQEQLNITRLTRHILSLQTRILKLHGIPDPTLDMELATAQSRLATDEKNLAYTQESYRKLASSLRPPLNDYFMSDTDSVHSSSTSTKSSTVYRSGIPMKLQSHWPHYDDNNRLTPYAFFDKFKRQVIPELGDSIFRDYGHTYLTLLVTNNDFQDQLHAAFNKIRNESPDAVITLDTIEQTFLDICMTKEQREQCVKTITNVGRHEGESYRHFSARILRTAKQHRIEDNNKLILTMLQQQIPYRDLDMVNLQYLSHRNQTMPDAPRQDTPT